MDEAVEDGIGERQVTDGGVPVWHRSLAGDGGGPSAMTVIDDF